MHITEIWKKSYFVESPGSINYCTCGTSRCLAHTIECLSIVQSTSWDSAHTLRVNEQEENRSIEPAAEATFCACWNQAPKHTFSRSKLGKVRIFCLGKTGQIDLTWSDLVTLVFVEVQKLRNYGCDNYDGRKQHDHTWLLVVMLRFINSTHFLAAAFRFALIALFWHMRKATNWPGGLRRR